MKKIAALFLVIFSFSAVAQEKEVVAVLIDRVDFVADDFAGIDQFGNAYFIKDNTFIKADNRGTVEYKKLSLGRITHADIENPLLIALFYEDFNTVVLLDNQLNEIREINFGKPEIQIVAHAAAVSSRNQLWVFDSLSQRLGLYDYLRNTWQPITIPLRENIVSYNSDVNQFRWTDTKLEQYASDIFGKVRTLGKIPESNGLFQASDMLTLYNRDGKIYIQDDRSNMVYEVSGIDNSFKKIYYKDQILSIFTNNGITNYKIIIP